MFLPKSLTVLLLFYLTSVQGQEYAELSGDVTVAGLFGIQEPTQNGDCGAYIASSVQLMEAIKWVFMKLNDADYIHGVKIGLWSGKTCNDPERLGQFSFDLIKKMADERETSSASTVSPILGLLGPEYSHEAQTVSRTLSSLPANDRLLQIGFSTTAETLSDHSEFRNFYRVVPTDTVQIQTIVALLQKLEWNRVGLIHDNSVYGNTSGHNFMRLAESKHICIPYEATIPGSPPFDSEELRTIVNSLTNANNQLYGIVFLGTAESAKTLLGVFENNYDLSDMPIFVFSSDLQLKTDALSSSTGYIYKLAKGLLALSPPFHEKVEEFYSHWKSIFKNITALREQSTSNPWLLDLFYSKRGCRPTDSTACTPLTEIEIDQSFPQAMFTEQAIIAAYVMAKSVKQTIGNICGSGVPGLCANFVDRLSRSTLIDNMATMTIDLQGNSDFPFIPQSIQRYEILTFDSNGNIVVPHGHSTYQIYNLQECQGGFCFIKVGDFTNGSVEMNPDDIKVYNANGKVSEQGKAARYATCRPGSVCEDCAQSHLADVVVYIPGDVLLVALLPIYDDAGPLGCDNIRSFQSVDMAEAVRFALEEVNSDPNVFPDQTVGAVLINTCKSSLVTQEQILSLHKNGLPLPDGSFDPTLAKRILGYVGPLHSSVAFSVSAVLKELRYFMISTGATAAALSDRKTHPYFLRVPTPDDKQGKAMMAILKKLDVNYIQIVYSNEGYGQGGREVVTEIAKSYEICVANTFAVKDNTNLILNELRKNGHARVVIMWMIPDVMVKAVQAVADKMREGEFVFIGSESWETNLNVIQNRPLTRGSITLALQMPLNPTFKTYYQQKNEKLDFDVDPWLQPYVEAKFDCYYPGSFNKKGPTECLPLSDTFGSDYRHDLWTAFALNASLIALRGGYKALKEICGSVHVKDCDDYRDNPQRVVDIIRQETVYIDGKFVRAFDDNGDGTVGYKIYNVQKDKDDPQKLVYVQVGQWLGTGGEHGTFEFEMAKLETPNDGEVLSVCPNELVCSRCFNNTPPPVTSQQSL